MTNTTNLFFVGLPGSGKTTFLAALWHVLEDRSSTTSLRIRELSADRTYLHQIADDWRACSVVQRTKLDPEQRVTLHLEGAGGNTFDLIVPDLSGEAFEKQLVDRKMSVSHDALVQQAAGLVLFVHPHLKEGTELSYSRQLQATIESGVQEVVSHDRGSIAEPWNVELLPTQVALIELLQFVVERSSRKVRIAVVLSAWDLVNNGDTIAPRDFMNREMPLLNQFLNANDDLMEHEVFGVSAQGGDISVETKRMALLELDDALKRILVQFGNDITQDITKPIAWILEER